MATHSNLEPGVPSVLEARSRPAKAAKRLEFLYRVTEDTQNTIRFLDTKAAFCVTLLSGMTALALQRPRSHSRLESIVFKVFMVAAVVGLLTCLRVIFPTIKPSGKLFGKVKRAPGVPIPPRFYVGHNKAHRWVRNTLSNQVDEVLNETHDTYLAELQAATNDALIWSMCDEVLMVALIRQVKSDRLHAAMICIVFTVLAFAVLALS